MMFFRSVGAVFRGISAFPEFSKRNPFRALFHLFLFTLLTALICSGIQTAFIAKKVDLCTNGLQKQFGRIQISENGILPEKNVKDSWSFYFPGDVRLDYYSPNGELTVPAMESWKQRMGIFWTRRGFLIWMRPDPSRDLYYTMPYINSAEAVQFLPSGMSFFKSMTRANVTEELKRYQEKTEVKGIPVSNYEFSTVGKTIKIYVYFALAFTSLVGNFILTLILILMFAGLQALWKANGLETLKFGGTVSLLCYAAFPALAIRMLLESFSFAGAGEILFFIVFFIYQMIAFHEVRRSVSDGDSGDDGSNH